MMINSFEQLQNIEPAAADYITTLAGAQVAEVERVQRDLPKNARLTGPEKKALVVGQVKKGLASKVKEIEAKPENKISDHERALMAFMHTLNATLNANNPLAGAAINVIGPNIDEVLDSFTPMLEDAAEWAFQTLADLWDGLVNWGSDQAVNDGQ